jgi:ATP-dependent Lhr-like helicase
LARINRRMLDGLRREIEPATTAEYLRFLLGWQHVRPGTQLAGRAGLAQVVAQLQGFEIAAGAWEREILPARVTGYDPAWLDALCLSGEVAWGRLASRESASAPSRAAPIALVQRRDLGWMLCPPKDDVVTGLSAGAQDVLRFLGTAGASFLDEIIAGAGRLRSEVEDALWELVSAGRVTGDGFGGLRALISATQSRGGARARWHARWTRRMGGPVGAGRWALLRGPARPTATTTPADDATDSEDLHEAFARQYVKRYGVVFRDVLAREPHAPAWRDLLKVFRRLEMRGELRGGRLVGGFIGEQFAAPEAVESLRAVRRLAAKGEAEQTTEQTTKQMTKQMTKTGEIVRLSACDPLNLVGILTPGPRVPATLANSVIFRDGVPVSDTLAVQSPGVIFQTSASAITGMQDEL